MATPVPQPIAVSPPTLWAPLSMALLVGVLPLAMIGHTLLQDPSHWETTRWGLAFPVGFVVALLIGLLLLMRRRAVEWRDGTLCIRAALYTKRIATAELPDGEELSGQGGRPVRDRGRGREQGTGATSGSVMSSSISTV